MAIIEITVANPINGSALFDSVRFYEATDANGTGATLIATVDMDTSNRQQIDPGMTTYTHTDGDVAKYYAAKYYNTDTSTESELTPWTLGGADRWDNMFANEMQDTDNAVWSVSDVARFKQWALEALYPELYRQVIDTTLTLGNVEPQEYTYEVPFGIFHISEVGVGDINRSTSRFQRVHPDNWRFENNVLHLDRIPTSSEGATIRLIAHKKFMAVGEVPERLDALVMNHMKMNAYLRLADDFPRFNRWARLQEGTRVSFENLRVHAREFERKFREEKLSIAETFYPSLL